jgi:hypothetical protein
MEYQTILSQKYVEELQRGVRNGTTLSLYQNASFELEADKLLQSPVIPKPERSALRMPDGEGNHDFQNAKILFEAYRHLTPLQASDARFWTYLTHADYYQYMKQRWPDTHSTTGEGRKDYVLEHWFIISAVQENLMRHGLAGLWWGTYLSFDETRQDPYSLTEQLFRQVDFRARTLGAQSLARHKEAARGILEFMTENPDLFATRLQEKTRFLTKYMNQLGGSRPVSYFDSHFFKASLQSISNKIASI